MSIESAKAYVERMKNDEEFRKKVLACTDAKKRMEFVKKEGFDFTECDIRVVSAVLDDDELSMAAGGRWQDDLRDAGKKIGCVFSFGLGDRS